uniref:Family with sequence similarity 170 member A n=1 Tax=Suricata suricatta TaxID=37032 RepID=A0A673T6X9_SURSU
MEALSYIKMRLLLDTPRCQRVLPPFHMPLSQDIWSVLLNASLCSEHPKGERLRLMKIYYMHVHMKRGVAVLRGGENKMEPPSKRTKIEEMTVFEKSPAEATLSHVSMKEFPTDNESRRNHKAQEEREEVEGPAEPPAPQECSRPQTPEWLMALESGYKCMGCCRVFPTLDVLKQHVQNGASEGFSCHAFHLAYTRLKWKKKKMEKKMRRKRKEMELTLRCQKGKHSGIKVSIQIKR